MEDQGPKIINYNQIYNDNLSRKVELLRSASFLSRAFGKLPLDISYFSKRDCSQF